MFKEDQVLSYSFRSFISLLEDKGDLIRVKREVDLNYDLASILWNFEKEGKAVLFENVKEKSFSAVGGLFQNLSRIHLGLNIPGKFNPEKISDKIGLALKNPIPYLTVESSPAKEVIEKGEDVNLNDLPIPIFFEEDAGPYITAGVCIVKHLDTVILNMGIYRIQVLDKNSIVIYGNPLSDIRKIYSMAEAKSYTNIEIAVAIGVDPAVLFAAILKPRTNLSELEIAGSLKGEPIKVVKCETVDLMVPCDAEIVLEGKVHVKKKVPEGPFSEIGGYYGKSLSPITEITALYHRKDSIFHAIMPGPSTEHFTLINIINFGMKKAIFRRLKAIFNDITNINVIWSPSTGTMMKLIISMSKTSEDAPKKILETAFNLKVGGTPISSFIKQVIIVDDDINIYEPVEVEWAINSRTPDESRILVLPNIRSWHLDCAVRSDGCSVRLGVDATKPLGKYERLKKVKIAENMSLGE